MSTMPTLLHEPWRTKPWVVRWYESAVQGDRPRRRGRLFADRDAAEAFAAELATVPVTAPPTASNGPPETPPRIPDGESAPSCHDAALANLPPDQGSARVAGPVGATNRTAGPDRLNGVLAMAAPHLGTALGAPALPSIIAAHRGVAMPSAGTALGSLAAPTIGAASSAGTPPLITLGRLIDEVLAARVAARSYATVQSYLHTIRQLLESFGPDRDIRTIEQRHAEAFLAGRRRCRGRGGDLSSWTIYHHRKHCRVIFSAAVDWGYLSRNPFIAPRYSSAAVLRIRGRSRPWHHLTPDEFQRMLAFVRRPQRRASYWLMYGCGLRPGEVYHLTADRIDLAARRVRIANRTATEDLPPFTIKCDEQSRGGKERTVPIPDAAIADVTRAMELSAQSGGLIALTGRRYRAIREQWRRCRAGQSWKTNISPGDGDGAQLGKRREGMNAASAEQLGKSATRLNVPSAGQLGDLAPSHVGFSAGQLGESAARVDSIGEGSSFNAPTLECRARNGHGVDHDCATEPARGNGSATNDDLPPNDGVCHHPGGSTASSDSSPIDSLSLRRQWQNRDMLNNLLRDTRGYLRRAGVELSAPFTLHTFRKSFAQNHAAAGTPPRTLARLLGHSDVSVTLQYYNCVTDANERAAVETINRLFEPSPKPRRRRAATRRRLG